MSEFHLFDVYGIEIEYMLVDAEFLDVRPVASAVLRDEAGEVVNLVEDGPISWSNELAGHVVELKTTQPEPALEPLPELFAASLARLRARLPAGVTLMPGATHPWMNPDLEFVRWKGDDAEIYAAFDRIFDCRGHGWSNLQSVHVNLPFSGDREFARLHEAIRLTLPLIPALSAASPVMDGRVQPALDARLEVYATNARRIPEVSGRVVPEPASSRRDYEATILEPLYRALAPHDPDGILRYEWANARGAIARFDRSAIEIRVIDAQECPRMDLAVAAAVVALVRALALAPAADDPPLDADRLAAIYREVVRSADRATVEDAEYLRRLGFDGGPLTAMEVWTRRLDELGLLRRGSPWAEDLGLLLERGPLARRLLSGLPETPGRDELRAMGRSLVGALRDNAPIRG